MLCSISQNAPAGTLPWDVIARPKALSLRAYLMLQALIFDRLMIGDFDGCPAGPRHFRSSDAQFRLHAA